ncbi:hypothetical protein Csp2054_10210 [Curtobacterium sp. 'Ferrero']|uniref:hypothetical protein n=1 Tax=Curtobacterium sp. 'Ferrero' TaxID=2033654 RepID=UPI000BDBDEE5|nr:hypothetical protein [Curtobacterium sp. 'Ferrero']PCN47738.1 hypothetical protein Csp2054_10210 [Curtobacterium sp. 'Ferrero']
MTLLAHQDLARPVSSNWPAPTDNPVLDRVLSGLERRAAELPHAVAVPVMLVHAGICALVQR